MTTETLMTEAAPQANSGADASQTVETVETKVETTTAQSSEGQTTTQEATKAEGEATTEAETKPTEKEGAPEKYEFKAPEGAALDDKVSEAFAEVARELDLPQDAAQKVIDRVAPLMAQRQAEALTAARAQWAETTTADKEIGGAKLTENLAVARKALDQFGTPELKTLLQESGLGNHPEIVRAFYRAGKAISEDKFVAGSIGRSGTTRDAASALYPTQH